MRRVRVARVHDTFELIAAAGERGIEVEKPDK